MVVISTLFDLYFSLAVRTFYLNLANGGELTEAEERELLRKEREKREKERVERQKQEVEKKKALAAAAIKRKFLEKQAEMEK